MYESLNLTWQTRIKPLATYSHWISIWPKLCFKLCWFQTSLPLPALPLCCVTIACCFRVAALSGDAALALAALLPSWIEFNCLRSAALGKAARLSIYLQDAACQLAHPSVASGACAVVQISSKRQCSERQASLKAALFMLLRVGIAP